MKARAIHRQARGQSLIEVLIAVAIGAIMLAAGAALIQPALRENTDVGQIQAMTALGNGLLNNVQAWAAGNWNALLSLATTSAHLYYLNTSSTPFAAVATSSGESVTISGITYIRSFYVNNVYRDSNGNVTTTAGASTYDPSTIQITVTVSAPSSTAASTTLIAYLTRSAVNVFGQNDWSGGGGQSNPQTLASSTFATSTYVNASTAGQVTILPLPAGTPGIPTYSSIGSTTLTVSWASTTAITYYGLERGTDGTNFSQIVTTTAATYNDTGRTASTTYYYRARGWNILGWGSYSPSSSVTTTN